jgi:hypothetical protein
MTATVSIEVEGSRWRLWHGGRGVRVGPGATRVRGVWLTLSRECRGTDEMCWGRVLSKGRTVCMYRSMR